jgi:hypothetical protein
MFSKPLAVALLAAGCVTAAAGGAYVAVRQNSAPAALAQVPAAAPAEAPVHETEALIAPAAVPEALTVESPRPAAERRAVERVAEARRSTVAQPPRGIPSGPDRRQPATPSRDASPAAPPPSTAERAHSTPAPRPTIAESAPLAAGAPESDVAAAEDPVAAEAPALESPRRDPPAAAAPVYEELVVPAAAVMGLQIETPVSSERANVEDRVDARVTRDVLVDGRPVVPAGTRVLGAVTLVDRGGRVKERARLGVRFHTLVLADGTSLPLRTEPILREGDSPAGSSSRKIGGAAVGGAILGAIMGGKKGAIVGGATGAAGGTAVVMAGDPRPATLQPGTVVTVRLSAPLPVPVEKR